MGEPPAPGAEFELEIDLDDSRSPTWILSDGDSDLFTLGRVQLSAPPHYAPIQDGTIDVSSVAVDSPTETLVLPADLAPGNYELCNFDPDDLCIAIDVSS